MAIETRTSRNASLISQLIDRYAVEHQWGVDDYVVYVVPNEDWGRYLVVVKCNRFELRDEATYNKEIRSYLKEALIESPSFFRSIDLDVISLNGPFAFLDPR